MRRTFLRPLWLLAALSACAGDPETADGDRDDAARAGDATIDDEADGSADDATLPDAAAPAGDAAPDPPDLSVRPSPCPAICERLTACLPMTCAGGADTLAADTAAACAIECPANPAFAGEAEAQVECDALVEWAKTAVGAPLTDGCEVAPEGPIHHPECDEVGTLVARCAPPKCPPAADALPVVAHAFIVICDNAVNSGQVDANLIGSFVNENTPCDAGPIAGAIDRAVQPGGALARFCDEGPLVDPAVCESSCTTAAPCIPAGSDYDFARDPLLCQYVCMTDDDIAAEVWSCGAAVPDGADCAEVLACIE